MRFPAHKLILAAKSAVFLESFVWPEPVVALASSPSSSLAGGTPPKPQAQELVPLGDSEKADDAEEQGERSDEDLGEEKEEDLGEEKEKEQEEKAAGKNSPSSTMEEQSSQRSSTNTTKA